VKREAPSPSEPEVLDAIGERLREERVRAGISQRELARRLGLRVQTVRNWEADRSEPRSNRLQMLAGFLNVSMIWLLTGNGTGPSVERRERGGPAELTSILDEVRTLRLDSARIGERLGKLETRLRQISELV